MYVIEPWFEVIIIYFRVKQSIECKIRMIGVTDILEFKMAAIGHDHISYLY